MKTKEQLDKFINFIISFILFYVTSGFLVSVICNMNKWDINGTYLIALFPASVLALSIKNRIH